MLAPENEVRGYCIRCEDVASQYQKLEAERDRYKAALEEIKKVVGTSTLQWKIASNALERED